MRVQFLAVTLLVLCLVAGVVSGQEALSLSPTTFRPGDEAFLTIFITGLSSTDIIAITYDSPAGQFTVEPSYIDASRILAALPGEMMSTNGRVTVNVYVQRGELTQRYGPGYFNIEVPQEPEPFYLILPEVLYVEATSIEGAKVDFTVLANTGETASCNPSSGSTFALGGTRVNCTASNGIGQTATGQFDVFVVDNTPPVITVPEDIVAESAVVHFSVTAADNLDPNPTVVCSPASGSTFPNGTTRVKCYAYDHQLNYASASFLVTVPGGPPALVVPSEIIAEATSPEGAVVTYEVTATDNATVSCTPASGSTFALGQTTVNCSATNANGSATDSFIVNVIDFHAPILTVPDDMTVSATSPAGAVVQFTPTAVDAVDASVSIYCDPPSGSTFVIGTTVVQCFAMDDASNTDFGEFKITVIENPPPVITVPNDITREATGPGGAIVAFNVTATNDGVVTCTPSSGSLFALGTTTVNCTATNAGGSDSDSFKVTVVDTTPPVLAVPADITAEATSYAGAMVTYTATATDLVDGNVAVNCVPASGSTFALGTTLVQCTATDTRNNSSNDSFNVNVVDTTAPTIISVKPSLSSLWPPNHRMETVELLVIATDIADPAPVATIISVSSNQAVNGTGDGDSAPDWEITGPLSVKLRSERAGTQDRIYTITVEVTDASGNSSTETTTVRVTQSRRR